MRHTYPPAITMEDKDPKKPIGTWKYLVLLMLGVAAGVAAGRVLNPAPPVKVQIDPPPVQMPHVEHRHEELGETFQVRDRQSEQSK